MGTHKLPVSAKLEAILFYKAEEVSVKKLQELLGVGAQELKEALSELEAVLENRGLQLVRANDNISLGTAPEASSLIESIQREEISRDLGKAGLETLAIVLYKGPISRREIDYIRGVNSTFILRNLLVRGLIERVERSEKSGERGFLYRPTTELLSFMGISKIEDLPEYESVHKELAEMEKTIHEDEGREHREDAS